VFVRGKWQWRKVPLREGADFVRPSEWFMVASTNLVIEPRHRLIVLMAGSSGESEFVPCAVGAVASIVLLARAVADFWLSGEGPGRRCQTGG